jgi:hypothetical protein
MGSNKTFYIVLVSAVVLIAGAIVFFFVRAMPSGQTNEAGEISNGGEMVLDAPPQTADCDNGGDNIRYNAVLFDNAREWLHEDFLDENKTYGDWGALETDPFGDYPAYIIKIIDSENFDEIFSSFPYEIDFNNEMLILYAFTCSRGYRPFELRSININEQVLYVEYRLTPRRRDVFDASTPRTRWFVIRLDKLDITEVEFSRLPHL